MESLFLQMMRVRLKEMTLLHRILEQSSQMMGISLLINVLNADAHNGTVWFHTVLFLFYLKKSYIKNGESMAFSVKLK